MKASPRVISVLIICCFLSACSARRGHQSAAFTPQSIGAGYRLRKLSDPNLDNPEYRHYAKVIFDKIGKNAYKNAFALGEGEVQLVFDVACDGQLKEFNVGMEQTTASKEVVEDAVIALKKSAPFPPFPGLLKEKYKELTFTVELSYRTDREKF